MLYQYQRSENRVEGMLENYDFKLGLLFKYFKCCSSVGLMLNFSAVFAFA